MAVLRIDDLPRISDSYYKSAFATFKQSLRNDNRLDIISTLKGKLVPLLPPASEPLRILSVGAGTGEFDYLLLHEIFIPHTNLIHYDALEPSEELHAIFAKRLEEDPVEGVQLHKTTYEDFKPLPGNPYDLLLFIHSMYYLPLDTIATAIETFLPANAGAIVVSMDSASGHAELHKALGLAEGPHTRCLNDVLEPVKDIVSENLKNLEVLHMPQWIDIEDCFLDESQAGLDLLSFAIHRDLRKSENLREMLAEIRSQANVHFRIEELEGKRHWWAPEGVALISNAAK